ncbi:MAG: HIT family protein [Candidatus Magasanikbacteria bacterium]|nr:HIT family protein [Candidatus Magasanikbacteria bacterium]
MDCIFCKIINKEIPNYTVYEDDHVLAFLDIFPHAEGHTVVIPKVHAHNLVELSQDFIEPLFSGVKKVQEKLMVALNPEGFSVGWNHGEAGGQAVPHLHIHILPRWNNDGGGSMHSLTKKLENPDVKAVFAKL